MQVIPYFENHHCNVQTMFINEGQVRRESLTLGKAVIEHNRHFTGNIPL
jgi:hypothetical protein